MKKLLPIIAILLTLICILLIYSNIQNQTVINTVFWGEKTLSLWLILVCFGFFITITVLSFVSWFLVFKTDFNKNYQLKLDKMSVQSDNDKSQVKILENKIKTLEAVIEKLTKEN